MRRLIWAFVCSQCGRFKISHGSRYWEFCLKLYLLNVFWLSDGKSRLVRSTVGSRLWDIGCNEGKKLCMCVAFSVKMLIRNCYIFIIEWMVIPSWVHCQSRGCGFELCRRHCVVSLSKTLYPLLTPGSTQEDPLPAWLKKCWLGRKESNLTNKTNFIPS